jgi:hypothetical protein
MLLSFAQRFAHVGGTMAGAGASRLIDREPAYRTPCLLAQTRKGRCRLASIQVEFNSAIQCPAIAGDILLQTFVLLPVKPQNRFAPSADRKGD